MNQALHPARAGRSMAAGVARAWRLALLVAPLLIGACSSSSAGSDSKGGSAPGAGSQSSATKSSGGAAGGIGISIGGSSQDSSAARGGASSSASSSSGSAEAGNGGSAQGGRSSSSSSSFGGASAGGGASYGGASSSSNASGSKGGISLGGVSGSSGMAGAGGAGVSSSGASSPATSGGAAGAGGGSTGTKASTGMGGATGMGGRTSGTGTAAGGSTTVPSADAGVAGDSGISGCSFPGGAVTAAIYPGGLTLRKACSPYFVSSISVYDDGVLTVEPGVTVKFGNSGLLSVGVQGSGRLIAAGSSAELITFTSQETQPSPGFWRGILFDGGTASGSKIAYAQITAAGQNRDGAIVGTPELPAHALSVDHTTIDRVGDGASGVLALGEKSAIAISNSAFVDVPSGRYPISVYAASFSAIGAGNTYPSGSAIEVMGGTIDANATWTNPGLPVVITGDLFIEGVSNPVLSVGSGMNLKFGPSVAVQVGKSASGKITLGGTTQARVTLTSLSGSPGGWAGLQIWDSGRASVSYADVRYGGSNNGDSRGNVTMESSAATAQLAVDHSSFSDSLGWGIYLPCATSNQSAAIITVDSNTTYANNALGTKGPGLTCGN